MGCTSEKNFPDSTKSKNGNDNSRNENLSQIKNSQISFRCFYDIKKIYLEINIINKHIDGELKSKIKLLNNNKQEEIIFTKNFNKIGIYTIDFIIERKLTNMRNIFCGCA